MQTILKDVGLGLLRNLATGSGGWLLAHGVITADQVSGYVGSVFFLGGLLFSAYANFKSGKAKLNVQQQEGKSL